MDVFELRERLVGDYGSYVGSFIRIKDARIEEQVRQSLDEGLLWPDPLIQLNPSFEAGETIDELVGEGVLHEECARVFRTNKGLHDNGKDLKLHRHQSKAVRTAYAGHNYVLTTGTGSGKSLAYIIPIEEAFSKIKGTMRKAGACAREALIEAMGRALDAVTDRDARGFFRHCGYRTTD